MEVILLERIEKLGQMGDVVNVKTGFARNYLLPQNKALRKTKQNLSRFESERAQLEADNLTRKNEAENIAGKLENMNVTIIRAAGETGQLYGSVTSRDIAEGVTKAGISINKNQVILNRALKVLGLEPIRISLHPEVSVEVTANIARNKEEAEQQLSQGYAVSAVPVEEDRQPEKASTPSSDNTDDPIKANLVASEDEGKED
ncbi:MAG: 50S ribosomal protein L9 [Rhodospirillaceae bacterium]|nr:50S ribosomal protein L9 [Rhodospirillaceae bacterium]OUU29087.1 MAG: 50S ribosomal protein L9 [Candidatus Endolissoclinum sp. TMED37]